MLGYLKELASRRRSRLALLRGQPTSGNDALVSGEAVRHVMQPQSEIDTHSNALLSSWMKASPGNGR